MRILVAPGQGSQSAGFLLPWLAEFPDLTNLLNKFGEAAGVDLVRMGTTADDETIKDTAVAQPLIVGSSLAIARVTGLAERFDGYAGHSVGEFCAAALAGVIDDESAMRLVGVRGRAMARAAAANSTGMVAVIGSDEPEITRAVAAAGLTIANYNGAGQFVAAGETSKIESFIADPPEKTRVVPLKVAGAFHTHFMAEAVDELRHEAAKVEVRDPAKRLWTNFDGSQMANGEEVLESLVAQVSRPVRWDLCMRSFESSGLETVVELPPAGALTGLLKRGVPEASAIGLKTVADLERV